MLQKLDRDTLRCAFKTSAMVRRACYPAQTSRTADIALALNVYYYHHGSPTPTPSLLLQVQDGVEREVYKDPVTDPGKTSKRGRLVLVKEDGVFRWPGGEGPVAVVLAVAVAVVAVSKEAKEYSGP